MRALRSPGGQGPDRPLDGHQEDSLSSYRAAAVVHSASDQSESWFYFISTAFNVRYLLICSVHFLCSSFALFSSLLLFF